MTKEQSDLLQQLSNQLPASLGKRIRQVFPLVFFPEMSIIKVESDNGYYVGLDRD